MVEWLILHTAAVLALAAVALGLGRLLRLGPAARHALWLVVLVKFLTPPVVHWPWALPGPVRAPPAAAHPAPAEAAAEPPAGEDPAPTPRRVVVVDVPADTLLSLSADAPAPAPEADARGPTLDLVGLAGLAWFAGAAGVALVQLSRALRLRRLLAHARPAPAWLEAEVRQLAEAVGARPPAVRLLPGIVSPLVWGGGRPVLLWPGGLERDLTEEGRRAVLLHELAHLRRRDHWVAWLLLAGGCVWWWHPLFRLVRRRLGREAELACDAWVVQTLPGARRAYAEALLAVCARGAAPEAAPALGVVGRKHDLERRLLMVMRGQDCCRLSRQVLMAAGVLALLALPAWTVGQVTRPAPAPEVTGKPAVIADTVLEKAAKAPSGDDKKLEQLEAKLAALLKEVQALRKGASPKGDSEAYRATLRAIEDDRGRLWYITDKIVEAEAKRKGADAPKEVTLVRTEYLLHAPKGKALADFLQENVKGFDLEVKVKGDYVTVTTTPDVQPFIGKLVLLMKGKAPEAGAGRPRTTSAP